MDGSNRSSPRLSLKASLVYANGGDAVPRRNGSSSMSMTRARSNASRHRSQPGKEIRHGPAEHRRTAGAIGHSARPNLHAQATGRRDRRQTQQACQVADYSVGFSSVFGSWGLLASREGAGFIPRTSRIALLRRFRTSSRADPSAIILEICMVCSLQGQAGLIGLCAPSGCSVRNWGQAYSRRTTLSSEEWTWRWPLYAMKPSFLNLFMN
jgi:hypothetical protein